MKLISQTFARCENIGLYQDDDQNYYLQSDGMLLNESDRGFWANVAELFPTQTHLSQMIVNKPEPQSFIPSAVFEMAMAAV